MPLARNLEDLPKAEQRGKVAQSPEADRLVMPIFEAWLDEYRAADGFDLPHAVPGTRFRASWAGGCSRQLGYKVIEHDAQIAAKNQIGDAEQVTAIRDAYAPTNPPSLADYWRMDSGTVVHETLQRLAMKVWPGCVVEQKVDLRPDVDGSASVDVLIDEEQDVGGPFCRRRRTLIEIKTKGGFAFKKATIGSAEGPALANKLQAGLAARALGADQVIILWIAQESISVGVAAKNGLEDHERFIGRWLYTMDELAPLLDAETRRINKVLALVDEGKLPPRAISDDEVPPQARVTNPKTGLWTVVADGKIRESGRYFMCDGYCPYQDRCIADGEDAVVPVELRLR